MPATTTIWKCEVPVTDHAIVEVPEDAKFLSVAVQHGGLMAWFLTSGDAPLVRKGLRVIGTGHPILDEKLGRFLGMVQLHNGALIFHIFEEALGK